MIGTHAITSEQAELHRLEIDSSQLLEIISHVQEWLPYEGCGMLATEGSRVVRVYPGNNVARSTTFYEMEPKQVLAAMRDIDERGLRMGAIFHSHPSTEAYPSPTDLELIFDPGVYLIIVSLAGAEPDVRAFRYDGEIREVPLILVDDPAGDRP
jgi:proteasome lid subunit RPN8/RPN11